MGKSSSKISKHQIVLVLLMFIGGIVILFFIPSNRMVRKVYKLNSDKVRQSIGTTGMINIVYEKKNEEKIQKIIKNVPNKIEQYSKIFSRHKENSELSRLNSQDKGVYKVSPALYDVLKTSKEIYNNTQVFDVTLLPLIKLWDYETQRVPTRRELFFVKFKIGSDAYNLMDDSQIQKLKPLQFDLGGIAKGYIIDKIVEYLKANKIQSAIIELGGDIYAFGKKYKWVIGVIDPKTKKPFYQIKVQDKAVVTSGDYERFFVKNGITYSHIIDPRIKAPAVVKAHSVTVIGPDTTIADALATAFFILGPEASFEILKNHYKKYSAFFIMEDKSVQKSEYFPYPFSKIKEKKKTYKNGHSGSTKKKKAKETQNK